MNVTRSCAGGPRTDPSQSFKPTFDLWAFCRPPSEPRSDFRPQERWFACRRMSERPCEKRTRPPHGWTGSLSVEVKSLIGDLPTVKVRRRQIRPRGWGASQGAIRTTQGQPRRASESHSIPWIRELRLPSRHLAPSGPSPKSCTRWLQAPRVGKGLARIENYPMRPPSGGRSQVRVRLLCTRNLVAFSVGFPPGKQVAGPSVSTARKLRPC